MDKLITTFAGKMPLVLEDIEFNDESYRKILNLTFKSFNVTGAVGFIVSGCEHSGIGGVVSVQKGVIYLNEELYYFAGGTITADVNNVYLKAEITFDAAGNKTFGDGNPRQVYQLRRAVLTTTASQTVKLTGTGSYKLETLITALMAQGEPTGWVQPTLGEEFNHVVNNALHYRRRFGYIEIKGAVSTDTHSSQSSLFTLPGGYRPAHEFVQRIVYNTAGDNIIITIPTSGGINIGTPDIVGNKIIHINFNIPL